jgi:predicted phage replisome organizer
MAKRYYWLKLKDDFFTDKRIKKLRRIAGGDTYTIIYLKMMMKCMNNDGILEYDGIEDSFADELALDLDEDADNVQITVNFLMQAGLLEEMGENHFLMTEVPELVGSETASAQRVRDFRNKQKALQCNTDVTEVKQLCSVEKEKEKEKDKDIEKREEKRESINYQQIADMYNDTCVSFPRLTTLSDTRKKAIRARLNTYTIDDFALMFAKAEASSFLKGGNDRNWSATFDWMIKDSNMAKILDGNYDNKASGRATNNNGYTSSNKVADKLNESYDLINQWVHEREG